ncbi:MAG: hypothetical protein VX294_03340 [Candidatus Latescibacterota bacterium]|nr:hypothetical protein [Candidatus Latescibacterota bacterium]
MSEVKIQIDQLVDDRRLLRNDYETKLAIALRVGMPFIFRLNFALIPISDI